MAIALTPFEGLCGFRPLENIKSNIEKYPEIIDAIGKNIVDEFLEITKNTENNNLMDVERNKNALKNLYRSLMEQDHTIIKTQLDKLIKRITEIDPNPSKGTLDEVLMRIEKQYPGDVGIFSIFLLNFVSLKPGEGLYLAANEPHAYVSG
eukprot:jgi/Orpsp1_1/1184876/evm.model.c7180000091356.1